MANSIDDAVTLLCGDAGAALDTLPAQSVHTCITSPSYFGLRDYGCAGQIGLEATPQEYVAALVDVFRGVKRVLRDDGTLWCVLGDSYAMGTRGAGGHGKQHTNKGSVLADRSWRIPDGLRAKSLLGIPWRVAFALQDDGWLLRQELIWHKPNPMPESVKDRCTRGHETVFMLAKKPAYYYDQDAIREQPASWANRSGRGKYDGDATMKARALTVGLVPVGGRNKRSVWTVATAPLSSKKFGVDTEHYAAFPPELVRPMVRAATSERGVCPQCGSPWRRVVERTPAPRDEPEPKKLGNEAFFLGNRSPHKRGNVGLLNGSQLAAWHAQQLDGPPAWQPTCSCDAGEPVPAAVLDCFMGSGTTGVVAVQEGRRFVGIDLNSAYVGLARARIDAVQPPLPVALPVAL